jgi:hypothetical protein
MIKIYFDDEYIDENYYAGLTRDCTLFDGNFRVGVTICDTYKLTLNKEYGGQIPNIVKFYDEESLVKTLYIDDYSISDYTIEFELTDAMVKLNFNYDASPIILASDTESVKLIDILKDICEKAEISTDLESFNQSDLDISYYDNTISARDYISYMAELDGSYAYITADNKLAFKPFKSYYEKEISVDEISKYYVGTSNKITRVLFDNGTEYYEGKDETDDDMTYYINTDNVYCTSTEAVENMLQKLNDQVIYNFETENCPIEAEIGDIVTFTDGINKYPTIFQFNSSISMSGGEWFGGIKLDVSSAEQEETEISGEEQKIKAIKIKVDRNENKIAQTITETENIRDDLNNNYYTVQSTNELIQNSSDGITNTFSEAGGNNVLRNTGLWFENNDVDNPYEYWNGIAKKTTNDQASLNTSILLQEGIFSQEQDVPNGNYSISFYYKKLNSSAVASVTINDKTYSLDSEDWEQFYTGKQDDNGDYITFPISVNSKHISISFKTDINNSVEIYDLMCNKGTVKLAYSQNENEVTTDTVNISKGITITASTTDTKFRANSDGIRILNKNNDEKITEFTDKGLTTKEAIVENEATIVKLLIKDVDEQTWITRI